MEAWFDEKEVSTKNIYNEVSTKTVLFFHLRKPSIADKNAVGTEIDVPAEALHIKRYEQQYNDFLATKAPFVEESPVVENLHVVVEPDPVVDPIVLTDVVEDTTTEA